MPLLCVASPKGGVGKTTLAANLAHEMAKAGRLVVALDLDPQNALRLHFGVPLGDGAGVVPVLLQRLPWRSALRQTSSGVFLLPHGRLDMAGAVAFAEAVGRDPGLLAGPVREILADPAVTLVVDTPPGPSPMLAAVLPLTRVLATVLLPDATSMVLIPAIEQGQAYGQVAAAPGQARGFVLNQYDPRSRLARASAESARRHLGPRLFGVIYRDEYAAEAIATQRAIRDFAPYSKAGQDIAALAGVLTQALDGVQASVPAPGGAGLA